MMQPFDDRIREQFSDFSPEVPPHIWENIVAKKKKRRPFLWIWPLLLLGTGLLLTMNKMEEKGKMKIATREEKANGTVKTVQDKEAVRTGNINRDRTVRNQKETDFLATRSPKVVEKNAGTPLNFSGEVPTNSTVPEIRNQAITENTAITAASNLSKKKSPVMARSSISENSPEKMASESKEDFNGNDENIPAPANSSHPPLSVDELTTLRTAFEKIMTKAVSFRLSPPAISHQEIPCPERDAAGNKKYVEFYAGPDIVFRSFRDTGNSDYLVRRKETTSIAFAFSTGARFTKVFNNGMSIRTGLSYSHIREKFILAEGNVIRTVFILDQNGDTIGNYSTTGTLYRKTFNKYNTLDIPLSIGYEMGNGRLHTNINAGVIVNIYSWQKGLVVDTANKAINISTGSDPSPYQFKTNIGVGFLGSASFYYKMSQRMHLMAEPYFRYNLSTFNKEEITLKQKFHNAGLRLGIRYDLK